MPKPKLVEPGDGDDQVIVEAQDAPDVPAEVEIPVSVVAQTQGAWLLQWFDAVGRLRQSLSPDRLERSVLSHLESLPPYGDDIESVLVDICIPVSTQVATLHFMNVWNVKQISYQVMRDLLASQGGAEFIALEARVQRLNA